MSWFLGIVGQLRYLGHAVNTKACHKTDQNV